MSGKVKKISFIIFCFIYFVPSGHTSNGDNKTKTMPPVQPELFNAGKSSNRIDELVFAELRKRNTPPSELCADEVFVRRVYLDAIGTLPNSSEVKDFLSNKSPDKRSKLIDRLLARSEFSDYWSLKWCDLLRIKAEFPSNLWPNAVQAYHRWVRDSIRSNMPYDKFARRLLTSSGSNFREPPANFYRAFQERAPRQIAENVALVFMGVRLNTPAFTEEQTLGFSAFFAKIGYKNTDEWKEEIVFFNPDGKLVDPKTQKPVTPVTLDGKIFTIPSENDPRIALADWLTAPDNPWFARNIANRIWSWLMGSGIVNEPDDMRPSNLAWNPELLSYLEKELVKNKYDSIHIYRLILNSNTYQLSSKTNKWNGSDKDGFSHYRIRRIDAEPLIDAICQVTGTGEKYTSSIPEPFTFRPGNLRTIALADGSIDSTFLEIFGRPPRNTSFESERSSAPSVTQAQHLLNSSHIQMKIEKSGAIKLLIAAKKGNAYIIEELYLRILSRFPTEQEKNIAETYMSSQKRKLNDSVCDLAWALINSKEFILRH